MKSLHDECAAYNITFVFCGMGCRFVKDGKLYKIEGNSVQSKQAYKSGLSFQGKPINYELRYGVKSCVSKNRQSQGWRWGNRADSGLEPFLTARPGGQDGMHALA